MQPVMIDVAPRVPMNKPNPRQRKLRKIRAAIRVGIYENDLKLHIAIDRLMRRLAKEPRAPRR